MVSITKNSKLHTFDSTLTWKANGFKPQMEKNSDFSDFFLPEKALKGSIELILVNFQ